MSDLTMVPSGSAMLAVRVDGDAGSPWLVLSNSLGMDISMWDAQMPALTQTHRVVRYDTRGHGRSTTPGGVYDFSMLVDDMVAVMDHLSIERADVLAMALGGMTVLGLAITYPQRVNRVICGDARADAPEAFVASWARRIEAVTAGGMPAVLRETLERWFTRAFRERRPDVVEMAARMLLDTSPSGYCGCAAALKELNYLPRLPEMRASTLYVVGGEDTGSPPEVVRAMAEATPVAEMVVFPDVAHVSNMEAPELFNGAVRRFLDA